MDPLLSFEESDLCIQIKVLCYPTSIFSGKDLGLDSVLGVRRHGFICTVFASLNIIRTNCTHLELADESTTLVALLAATVGGLSPTNAGAFFVDAQLRPFHAIHFVVTHLLGSQR